MLTFHPSIYSHVLFFICTLSFVVFSNSGLIHILGHQGPHPDRKHRPDFHQAPATQRDHPPMTRQVATQITPVKYAPR